jgi:hypothetical protein
VPVDKRFEHEQTEADSAGKGASNSNSVRKGERKGPGTRFGTLADWREASHQTGIRYGRALRDGK